ncbi:TetR family transcriptional regulator [Mesobaculum littorinae]|uniref:TetR family transcriptional regulator n=1 Tax=Mesobaculum littorinae TaxID=2486419 RepID=A0A438AKQ2_9RHOB|nr:TetR family transcriptional regulator C-terminal domain-containing protein [Mesobaculum littorinae]RVV99298.1 TetR family transcriptional regulator [Mesobaculum littorinae]
MTRDGRTGGAPRTRIQQRNRRAILDAALDCFSAHGFRGATLDQIARAAGLSKPNLLYYFPSKDAMHAELLSSLLTTWLDPLRAIDPAGDPVEQILAYVHRKLEMSRDYPRESRLFANEILQGAPRFGDRIGGELKTLVDEKCAVIAQWQAEGRIAPLDPHHLIFSIWATTQHYADFEVQVDEILAQGRAAQFDAAAVFLDTIYRRTLRP